MHSLCHQAPKREKKYPVCSGSYRRSEKKSWGKKTGEKISRSSVCLGDPKFFFGKKSFWGNREPNWIYFLKEKKRRKGGTGCESADILTRTLFF
jgi:hypothetical protein